MVFSPAGPATLDDLPRLSWTNRVISEALRLFPAAHGVGRSPRHDQLLDGHRIPAGAWVELSIWGVHHSARVWSDPERFDPTRFELTEDVDPGGHKYAYLPFGAGPRACIGSTIALTEMKISVATSAPGVRHQHVPAADPRARCDHPAADRSGADHALVPLSDDACSDHRRLVDLEHAVRPDQLEGPALGGLAVAALLHVRDRRLAHDPESWRSRWSPSPSPCRPRSPRSCPAHRSVAGRRRSAAPRQRRCRRAAGRSSRSPLGSARPRSVRSEHRSATPKATLTPIRDWSCRLGWDPSPLSTAAARATAARPRPERAPP